MNEDMCDECFAFSQAGYFNLENWKMCPPDCWTRKTGEFYENRKKKEKNSDKFVFITINDKLRRIGDLEKLQLFIDRIKYVFKEAHWCLESGKVPLPDSNLHVHILGKYVNSKKGKGKCCLEWSKLFGNDLRDVGHHWDIQQWRNCDEMPSYDQWIEEKLEYFENEKKGNHGNVIDLGARGAWGSSTSN